jgi:hypothetical protein
MSRPHLLIFAAVVLGLGACAVPSSGPTFVSVPPGKLYAGGYINIKAPSSEGWLLVRSSAGGMEFGRRGPAPNENFGAQVLMFGLPPTKSTEEFEALVKSGVEKDTDPNRFDVQLATYKYSNERNYPCVRYHSLVQDKAPKGLKGPLLLESDALYCRHPVRQETGFAVIYHHRGEERYANLHSEAQAFIDGVEVPDKQ